MRHKPSPNNDPHRRPLSPRARLGLLAVAVQPLLLQLRAADLSMKITVASGHEEFAAFGARNNDNWGVALTVAAMLAASAYKQESESADPCPYLRFMGGGGWLALAIVDVFLSVWGTTGPWQAQIATAILELAKLMLETSLGILIVEHTLPEVLARSPSFFNGIARAWRRMRRK